MQDYLIKKDEYKFSNILSEGYEFDEQPVILDKSIKSNGNIKIIYADYNNITIGITFGQLSGEIIRLYTEKFEDGEYNVWNPNTGEYVSYNFIVTKGKKTMITSKNGERYKDFDIVLEKSSEVIE